MNEQEPITVDAKNIRKVSLLDKRLVKVSMILDLDEFKDQIWSNNFVKWSLPHCDVQKCNSENCNENYALIGGKDEAGKYCFNCANDETGKGYYCFKCSPKKLKLGPNDSNVLFPEYFCIECYDREQY